MRAPVPGTLGPAARERRPVYDRGALRTGIVHLGLGAFHRAHQAAYTDAVLEAGDRRWGIIAASLRSPALRDALAPQDGLYMRQRGASNVSRHRQLTQLWSRRKIPPIYSTRWPGPPRRSSPHRHRKGLLP